MLFKNDEIEQKQDEITAIFEGSTHSFIRSGGMSLKKFLPVIDLHKVTHYVTRARWSMHDLLRHLLSVSGPSDVYFTTWSITMEPASEIVSLKKAGMINNLNAIVDSRVKHNAPEAYQMLMLNATRLKLAKIHAKVMIVINNDFSFSVVSSQNFTNVKRIEAGIIDPNRNAALEHVEWIQKKINEKDERPNARGDF
jgi:hypothetical protein